MTLGDQLSAHLLSSAKFRGQTFLRTPWRTRDKDLGRLAAAVSANFDLRASPLLSNISCLFIAGKTLAVSSQEAAKRPKHGSTTLIPSGCLSCVTLAKQLTPLCLLSLESWLGTLVLGVWSCRTTLRSQSPRVWVWIVSLSLGRAFHLFSPSGKKLS